MSYRLPLLFYLLVFTLPNDHLFGAVVYLRQYLKYSFPCQGETLDCGRSGIDPTRSQTLGKYCHFLLTVGSSSVGLTMSFESIGYLVLRVCPLFFLN